MLNLVELSPCWREGRLREEVGVYSASRSDSVSCIELQGERQVQFSVASKAHATHERDKHEMLKART